MEAKLADELVALDAETGHCFGFNSVATTVWTLLEEPKSFDQIRAALLSEYDVPSEQCTRELEELMTDLESRGLVAAVDPHGNKVNP